MIKNWFYKMIIMILKFFVFNYGSWRSISKICFNKIIIVVLSRELRKSDWVKRVKERTSRFLSKILPDLYVVRLNLSLTDHVGPLTRREETLVLHEVSKQVTWRSGDSIYWVPPDGKTQGVDTTFALCVSTLR